MALPTARRATRISLPLVGALAVDVSACDGRCTFPALSLAPATVPAEAAA